MGQVKAPLRDDELSRIVSEAFTGQALHNVSAYARVSSDDYPTIEAYDKLSRQTMAAKLLRTGGHYQRLALLQDITDRYCESIGLTSSDIGYYSMFSIADPNVSAIDEARRCYDTAVLLDPDSPEIRFCLAVVQLTQNDTDSAAANFEKAAQLKSAFEADSYWNIACIHEMKGRDDEALKYFRMAAKSRESFGGAHVRISRLLRRAGHTQEALDHFEKSMTFGHTWLPEYHLAAASADDIKVVVGQAAGYNLFSARGQYHAVPIQLEGVSQDDLSKKGRMYPAGWRGFVDRCIEIVPPAFWLLRPLFHRFMPGTARRFLRRRVKSAPTIEALGMSFSMHAAKRMQQTRSSGIVPPARQPLLALNESVGNYDLYRRGELFYAAPKSVGLLHDHDLSLNERRRGGWRDVVDDFFHASPLAFKALRPLLGVGMPGVVRRIELKRVETGRSLTELKAKLAGH